MEVFEILKNNTLSRADLSDDDGMALNVHYGDILIKYGEVLDISKENMGYIVSSDLVQKFRSSFLKNGDIIIADTAEDETAGKCSEIANIRDLIAISGLHTIPVRPLFEYAKGYLGYYMNSPTYHDTLLPLMQGTKVTSISKSAFQSTAIKYPKQKEEQRLIGEYFIYLDNLITLHQRK